MPKFSDEVANWLYESNYRCCFFVAGGNIMHLMDSFSSKFLMIPVIHEVTAAIAADYFNEANSVSQGKAFALVTLGPGATNTATGVMGSYLDSRELLLISGQVKSQDLKNEKQRQRGIQEIDGVKFFQNFTKTAKRITEPICRDEFILAIDQSRLDRKGPVYIEICLDAQGADTTTSNEIKTGEKNLVKNKMKIPDLDESAIKEICQEIDKSNRPIFYIGGGVDRSLREQINQLDDLFIPVCTSWNAADRIDSSKSYYAGRPNLYGQRFANIYLQKADLIVIFGSSMGIQSTGFNFQEFAPNSRIIQIDIDPNVIAFSNLKLYKSIISDTNQFFIKLITEIRSSKIVKNKIWIDYLNFLKEKLPIVENSNVDGRYVNPFNLINKLTKLLKNDVNFVPCSSGGTYTSAMQVMEQQGNNLILSSKGLGSMGYGLAGAIGVSLANQNLTILFEGDGGFAQNVQELGVVSAQELNIKIFVFNNEGYASIRSTQNRYFKGNFVGSSIKTGVQIPNLELIANAFNIKYYRLSSTKEFEKIIDHELKITGPTIFEVIIDPELNYYPKIESKMGNNGQMVSQPLHMMVPEIESSINIEINDFWENLNEQN